MISPQALDDLKKLYFKHYGMLLNDQQALDLDIKLVDLFKVIARPIRKVDKKGHKDKQ